MKFESKFFYLLLSILIANLAEARLPFKDDWSQSFYTDDNTYYLTLYPDGFKQVIRVDSESCQQISKISIVLKDSTKMNKSTATRFRELTSDGIPKIYGINKSEYCWYEVSARGLSSINGVKYVLQIDDGSNTPYFFKGITSSLVPVHRLTQDPKIDSWIELGAFGATPVVGGGVFYKVWEPLTDEVHLFINTDQPIKLFSDFPLNDERRFHYAYIKSSNVKDQYHFQFVKNGAYENLEVANFKTFSPIKVDPMARELVYDDKGGRFNGYINPRGVVARDNEYIWKNDDSLKSLSDIDFNNWIIYQLWPLTFNPKQIGGAYVQGKFTDILPKIPYLNNLGVNAVEFLPVHESRFNASWGYALDSLIILEGTLGTKSDMKKVVDELHSNKLKVIFDVVVNHVNNSLLREPIGENSSTSKFYGGDTAWGPRPRFESVWVRKWITDSLLHIMAEYHLDGFRFDMTDSIFNGTRGGYRFLQELTYLIKMNNPRFYNSAEQLPNDVWVTYPISENGLGFDSQWNDRFKNFFELEFDNYSEKNRSVDLTHLSNALLGFSDHQMSPGAWYHFGNPQRTVNYLGSHDFIGNKNPMIRIVTKYSAQEQEDSNVFERVNPLEEEGDLEIPFRKIHNQFSHSLVRLSYGLLFTKPGASLFYQGEELAQDLNLQNEWAYVNALRDNRFPSKNINVNKYIRSHRMTWNYYDLAMGKKDPVLNFTTEADQNLFRGHLNFFKTMINFKKSNPEMNEKDAENVKFDNGAKIITYQINTSKASYFIVGNFNEDIGGAWIPFPGNNQMWWEEVINSSDPEFGGDSKIFQNAISNLGGRKNLLRLKGAGFYLFKAMKNPTVHEKLYFRTAANSWAVNEALALKVNSQNIEELNTVVAFSANQLVEFKLGSRDWAVDLGKAVDAGFLNYIPNSPTIKINVSAGKYLFKFNIRTFSYNFEKIN